MEIRKIIKLGHSLVVPIPDTYAKYLMYRRGDSLVVVMNRQKQLVVEKLDVKKHAKFFTMNPYEIIKYEKV